VQQGILDKYNVELIGAKLPSIDKAEDRELFKQVHLLLPGQWASERMELHKGTVIVSWQ
jgi:carbamoylphosphate synthase large subunit